MRRSRSSVVAIALALPTLLFAQQEVFRGGVDLISVDVVVLDKQGKPVPGLTPADFDVTVNNKKDAVKALYYVDRVKAVAEMAAGANPSAASAPAIAFNVSGGASVVQRPYAGRSILIGVNDISFRGLDAGPYTTDLANWVKTLDPADYVGVMTGSFRVAAPFSRDRKQVLDTLRDAAAGQMDPIRTGDIRFSIREARAVDENVGNSLDVFLGMIANNNVPDDAKIAWFRECPDKREYQMCFLRWRNEAQDLARQMDDYRIRSTNALKVFLETLKSAPPPRVLVVLADGAPLDDRTQFRDVIATAADAGAQVFLLTPDLNRASTAQDRDHTFSANDIPEESRTLNVGDGKSQAMMRFEDNEYLKTGLDRVADETGGRVIRLVTSATPALARVNDSTSGFYRLGISAPPELAKSGSVPLKIAVKRSGLQVTATSRLRYSTIEPSPVPVLVAANAPRPAAAAAAVPRVSAFPVDFQTTLQRDDSGQVRVVISAMAPSSVAGPVKVRVGFADATGQIVKSANADLLTAGTGEHRGSFAVSVPAGDYHLQVVASGADGREGWSERDVAAKLTSVGASFTASDILLAWAGDDRAFKRWTTEAVPAEAKYVMAAVELYPSAGVTAQPPDFQLVVRSVTGQQLFDSGVDTQPSGTKLVAVAVMPTDLPPGRHEVRIEARNGNALVATFSTHIIIGGAGAAR